MSDEPVKTVVLFRKYLTGDVVAVLPEHSADPEGNYAVAVGQGVGYYPVDPQSVIQVTVPASPTEYARLKRDVETMPTIDQLELFAGAVNGLALTDWKAIRKGNAERYMLYPRFKQAHSRSRRKSP